MKLECKFLSDPELDKPLGHDNLMISNENLDGSRNTVKEPGELKKTCLIGVMNGTAVSDKIASGRFGTVFVGTIMNSTLLVAVKEYHPTFHDGIPTEKGATSKLRELVGINHPGIVHTYSIAKFGDIVYKVMEFKPKTLHADISDKGKYDESQVKMVLVQITRALEYLHAQNVSHGTLHTKNIFITENHVQVSDVESSEFLQWLPFSRTPLCILPFIAPELHNQMSKVTPQSDLWSLGMCLYVMATGVAQFKENSRMRIENYIRNGFLSAPFYVSPKIGELLDGMLRVNPTERVTLKSLIEDEWISSDLVWDRLCDTHKALMEHVKKPVDKQVVQPIIARKTSKTSIDTIDEGYNSVASDQPDEPEKDEDKPEEPENSTPEVPPKRYYKRFAVYVMENVREEWDPDLTRIEKCTLSNGNPCLRIIIPTEEEVTTPTFLQRIQNRLGKTIKRFRAHQDTIVDLDFGDYALMNFRRETTGMEVARNIPKFANKRQAHLYFCKLEAERVWENVAVKVCMRCRRAGTDAIRHDEDRCLYKLLSEATESQEVVYYGQEDQFNIRFFSLVYRTDGGRAPPLTRFGRGSMRVISSGFQRILNRIRRQPTEN